MVNRDLAPIIGFRSYRLFSCRISANFWKEHREGANTYWPERKGGPELGLQFN